MPDGEAHRAAREVSRSAGDLPAQPARPAVARPVAVQPVAVGDGHAGRRREQAWFGGLRWINDQIAQLGGLPGHSLEDLLGAQEDAQLGIYQHRYAVEQVEEARSALLP